MEFWSDMSQLPWLRYEFLGNSVLSYILAFMLFFVCWSALELIRKQLIRQLGRLYRGGSRDFIEFCGNVLMELHPLVFPIIALHFALQKLNFSDKFETITAHVVASIVILQATAIFSRIIGYMATHLRLGKNHNDMAVQSAQRNLCVILKTLVWIAGLLFLFSNLGVNVTSFITGLGIGGIAIALAAQSILGDTFSSFVIALDKPFEIGDVIVVDGLKGTVEHVGLKTTRIRSVDGELLIFSNSMLTGSKIQNFQKMTSRRVKTRIGVVYSTSPETLRAIPDYVKQAISASEGARFERATFDIFGDSALQFEIVYHVESADPGKYAAIQHDINCKIFEILAAKKVDMAFPTQTLHIASVAK